MRTVNLYLPYSTSFERNSGLNVGIDRGAYLAIKEGIILDMAIGDFDSVSTEEFEFIINNVNDIIKLDSVKDDTDTDYAIKKFSDFDTINIYGGIAGKRIDHLLANIMLCFKYKNICFKDKNTLIYPLKEFNIIKNNKYKYISFFCTNNSVITLKGFKYELDNYKFNRFDTLCISNEFSNSEGLVKLDGEGVVILSVDDH